MERESFWIDTPFGISILGGIIPAVAGLIRLLAAALPRRNADAYTLTAEEWKWAVPRLALYALMMVVLSYLVILIWYLLAGLFFSLSIKLPAIVTWLICALLLFRSFLRR